MGDHLYDPLICLILTSLAEQALAFLGKGSATLEMPRIGATWLGHFPPLLFPLNPVEAIKVFRYTLLG